jgi:transposase
MAKSATMCTKLPQDALEERLRWVLSIMNKEIKLNEAAKVFNGGQRTLERWVKAYREDGDAGLTPKSTRPKSHPNETPIRIKERIKELRKKTKLCAKKLNYKLVKENIKINDRTIGKILEDVRRKSRLKRIQIWKFRRHANYVGNHLLHIK